MPEDYEQRLEGYVRASGWPEERIRELGHMVTHRPLVAAQDVLDVLVLAEQARQELDASLVSGEAALPWGDPRYKKYYEAG